MRPKFCWTRCLFPFPFCTALASDPELAVDNGDLLLTFVKLLHSMAAITAKLVTASCVGWNMFLLLCGS